MARILHFLIYVLILGVLTLWLMDNPGTICLTWLGYEIETSVAFTIALFLCLFIAIYILRLPVKFIRWVKKSFDVQKEKNKENMLVQILNAIAGGDEILCQKLAAKLDKAFDGKTPTPLLLKALLNPTPEIYRKLALNPTTELAGWRGLIAENQKQGDLIAALDLAQQAFKKYKNIPWVVLSTLELQVLNDHWKEALETLDVVRKLKLEDEHLYKTQKATLLIKTGNTLEAFKTAPWLPEAALKAAQDYPKKAEAILMKAWENQPDWNIYKAYIHLFSKENTLAQYKRVEKLVSLHKTNRINHLALADAALQAKLWGQARKELETYIASYSLTMQVATMMAFLEQEENHDQKEAQKWVDQMKNLEPTVNYFCTRCGHETDLWSPTCPVCNGFASLESL